MRLPAALPPSKHGVVEALVAGLSSLEGVMAVVLGGSYARGTAHPRSDVDLGIYYSEGCPFAIDDVRRVAESVSVSTREALVVTDFYEWGPWVNGGAWIWTASGKVDLIYRSVEHVRRVIEEAHRGEAPHHYGQQPAFGFYGVTYLGETDVCLPLYDPEGVVEELKRLVLEYPEPLRRAIVFTSLSGVEFALVFARKSAAQGDVYATVGCLARALAALTQVLYALNRTYFIGDRGTLEEIERFEIHPERYSARVGRLLSHAGCSSLDLKQTVEALSALFEETAALPGADYERRFEILEG